MKSLLAFLKKELTEQFRAGRLTILGILFLFIGIMNPAIAKLTPWLLKIMADSLESSGITVTDITVTAMDAWVQFFKNAPLGLLAFLLLESSTFTKEYRSGSLLLVLTKGLSRWKVVVAKTAVLILLWSACYWLSFGITDCYAAYFWDNSIVQNLTLSVTIWWLFGIWTVALAVFWSTVANSNTAVLCGTGSTVLLSYVIGLLPKVKEYMPTLLLDGNSLIYGTAESAMYTAAICITVAMSFLCPIAGMALFNKKQL